MTRALYEAPGQAYLNSLEKASILSTTRTRILNKLELSQVIGAATPRCRVLIALQAFSGIHSWVLGSADGTDGLLISDFCDSEITSAGLQFTEYPAIFKIRPTLNKQSILGYAGICEEGLIYINEYLSQRMHEGEVLSSSSPVIYCSDRQSAHMPSWDQFLPTSRIENEIHRVFISEKIPWSPPILRNYFESNLVRARQNNIITDQELNSLLNQSTIIMKSSLQSDPSFPSILHRIRRAYNACKPYVSTVLNARTHSSLFNESNGWVYV